MTFFIGPGIGNNSQAPEHLPALVILGAAAVDHVLEALRARAQQDHMSTEWFRLEPGGSACGLRQVERWWG